MTGINKPKILLFDLEWKPAVAYVWRMWDENVTPDQLIDEGGLLCFSAMWYGDKSVEFYSEWADGRQAMAEQLHRLFSEADAVIGYNSDKYDIPKAIGEMVLAGLKPPPQPTSIDLLKVVKKFGFVMNRLAYIGPLLGAGGKVKHEGFRLWRSVLEGDEKAQNRMRKYCIQDTKLLVLLYNRIKPFIRNHPHMGLTKGCECGTCGSKDVQSRGYRRTKSFKIQRLQCNSCGSWSDGKRTKV